MDDGERAVVFDRRSRQTHVLSPAARRALDLLISAGPLSMDELRRSLGEDPRPHGDGPGQDTDLAGELLATFDALGLVEPVGL